MIHQGSVVMVNLQSVFKDATIWGDPENFRPERHLNEEGKVIKNDAFIPFGLGNRTTLLTSIGSIIKSILLFRKTNLSGGIASEKHSIPLYCCSCQNI